MEFWDLHRLTSQNTIHSGLLISQQSHGAMTAQLHPRVMQGGDTGSQGPVWQMFLLIYLQIIELL
jgi:hypothetical protein